MQIKEISVSYHSIGTWVYRIASNICLRRIEKAAKMKRIDFNPPELNTEIQEGTDQINQLYQCIAQLGKTERLIILKPFGRPKKSIGSD